MNHNARQREKTSSNICRIDLFTLCFPNSARVMFSRGFALLYIHMHMDTLERNNSLRYHHVV